MSKSEIEQRAVDIEQKKKDDAQNLQNGFDFEELEQFYTVYANAEFKVPLKWFLNEVDIYYLCTRENKKYYKRLIPNLKKTFLRTEEAKKPYEKLEKYNLLRQEGIENAFVALNVEVKKCRPTALDRPPQFLCEIRPPVCFNNMTFSELSLYRKTDNKLMSKIKPGGYIYMYEGLKNDLSELNTIVEEDEKEDVDIKLKKKTQEEYDPRLTPVKLNQYVWRFEDDGNVIYESLPNCFYSKTIDNKFLPVEDLDNMSDNDQKTEEEVENMVNSISLKFEVVKLNILIYTPYVLINKTSINLYFGEKGKDNELVLLQPNTNQFFNPLKKKKKFSITSDDYEWAEEFDITTLGMSGEANMKRAKNFNPENDIIQRCNSNQINVGVLISTLSSPYGKTLSVKFVPRYIFVNNCTKAVVFSQDDKEAYIQYYANPGESITYLFENKKKENNYIFIREPRLTETSTHTLTSYEDIEVTEWSSRFSIDD